MVYRTKLNMADTWSEEVEACLITSLHKFQQLYDVSDKHDLSHVLKERAFRKIVEETNLYDR